jgi:hypothetical protein
MKMKTLDIWLRFGQSRTLCRTRATIPAYPARKFQYRVLVNEVEAMHFDRPVCVDHLIRRDMYDKDRAVGRFLRGPRRLSDEKVRQLRSAAGADMAHKWLTGNKPTTGNDSNAVAHEGHTP